MHLLKFNKKIDNILFLEYSTFLSLILMMIGGVFILILIIFWVSSYSQGLITSRIQNICTNEEYLTPSEYPITCCNGEALKPGITLEKFWTACATPDDAEEQRINETLWRIYSCIVDKYLVESGYNLTLANFAHLMTIQYPAKKRIEIFDKICKSSDLAYLNSDKLDALKGIRRKYYEIELQTCAKSNASIYIQKMKEYPSYEQIYMRGGQCLNSEIPIDPKYFPRASQNDTISTWKTLLETVSQQNDEDDDHNYYGSTIHKACDLYSDWIAKEIATGDEIFHSPPDFEVLFNRVKPSWANKNVTDLLQKKVDEYWINAFPGQIIGYRSTMNLSPSIKRKLMEDRAIFEAEKYFDTKLKYEFVELRDEPKAKTMMVSCLIPAFQLVSISESFTYLLCRPKI